MDDDDDDDEKYDYFSYYSLDHVKKRIIEYLSVVKIKGDLKAPIICLVGPVSFPKIPKILPILKHFLFIRITISFFFIKKILLLFSPV